MAHPYLEQIANKGALMRPKRQSFSHISETSNSNRSSSTVNRTDLNSGNFNKIQSAVYFGKNYDKFAKEKNIWYETLNWDSCWEKYLRIASCKNIYLQYRSEDRFGATFICRARDHYRLHSATGSDCRKFLHAQTSPV